MGSKRLLRRLLVLRMKKQHQAAAACMYRAMMGLVKNAALSANKLSRAVWILAGKSSHNFEEKHQALTLDTHITKQQWLTNSKT